MIDYRELNRLLDCVPSKRPRRYELQQDRKRKGCFGFTGLLHYKRKIGLERPLGSPMHTWESIEFENKMKRHYKRMGITSPF